jgi:hypothetical protein
MSKKKGIFSAVATQPTRALFWLSLICASSLSEAFNPSSSLVDQSLKPSHQRLSASPSLCLPLRQPFRESPKRPSPLYSTPPEQDLDDEELPDEIAALLAKGKKLRAKMEERKREEPPVMEQMVEVNEWTDFDKLPEFKTKIPERKKEEPKEDEGDEKKKQSAARREIVDYKMDYEDENELHIPNRLGFTTRKWGDTSQGFVTASNQKLSKKMKRAGMFLPGDCQVAYNMMLESSIFFVETSETYGKGSRGMQMSAEDILARCIAENTDFDAPLVASTFGGRVLGRGIPARLEESCNRMGQPAIELYQSRRCFGLGKAFLQALEEGMCNYVGVIDFGKRSMRRMANFLDDNGFSLTSNQVSLTCFVSCVASKSLLFCVGCTDDSTLHMYACIV